MRDDATEPASLDRSDRLKARAIGLIPGGAQTGSKAPDRYVQGVAPAYIERGEGSHVWDADGNEYVDYPMGRGPPILGHAHPAVTEAVEEQVGDGTAFSMPHPLGVEVAEAVREAVPPAEMVRFAKNGHDVTALAAKLARAHTGNDVIATHGYHGWPDVWCGGDRGVPDVVGPLTQSFSYNDVRSLERIFEEHPDDVAGIVMTPVGTTPPEDGFLERVREVADREGVPLIFDEIITGFRFSMGGAAEFFGVEPDLACFAKALANGYPLSAIAGRRELMSILEADDVTFSLTYGGEAASLAAADACLEVLRTEPVFEHIFERGRELREGYNEVAAEHGLDDRTECTGYPPRTRIGFRDDPDDLVRSLFAQECLKRGVVFDAIHFPTYGHTAADVEYTLEVYRDAMAELADAIDAGEVADRLEGEPIGAPIREPD